MKKHKKSGRWETRISGHSQRFCLSTHRKALRVLVVLVVVCTATARVFSLRSLSRPGEKQRHTKQSSNELLPVIEPLRTAQEVTALKKEELELVEKLMREFPVSDDSFVIMGNLWFRHGNAIEALKYWNKALRINPKRSDVYRSMGWVFLKRGEFEESIAQYRKTLELKPRLPDVHSNIGHALMMSGRHHEAVEELEKELQVSPQSSFAHFLLGQTYLLQKEYQKAKEHYEAAIKIKPDYTNAYYGLACVCANCANLGDSDKAKEYSANFRKLKAEGRKGLKGRKIEYDDFVETQKSAAITYINVGRMYRDNGKLNEAEQLLKRAAGLDAENVVCFLELASLYQANGQTAKALQMHKKISEIQPESSISYLFIGILSAHLKKFDDAEQAFSKMITLAPQGSDGYRELARLYLKTGQKLPQARQLAEKAVSLSAIAANYFVLGWACYANGDTASALPAVRRALELEPDNVQYLRLYQQIQQRSSRYGPYR
jgi:tetratricopeptide (TPR) repeat protein